MKIGKALCVCLFAAAGIGAGGLERPASAASDTLYDATCRTFENRARFRPRAETVDFIVLLAEACGAARRSMASGDHGDRALAEAFLNRLVLFRDTVIAINMERLFGRGAGPFDKPLISGGRQTVFAGVSETGEFLIAHRMGLLDAFDRWRETAPDFTLALTGRPKG